jgi:hypothetical protein
MDIRMIVLAGQGDIMVKVVSEETFAWLSSAPHFGGDDNSALEEEGQVPERQLEKLRDEDDDFDGVYITSGSWENDRALSAVSDVEGYKSSYLDLTEALKAVKDRDDTVVDTYEGMIY